MNRLPPFNRLTRLLLAGMAFFVLAAAAEILLLGGEPKPADIAGDAAAPVLPEPAELRYDAPALEDYVNVLDRPLFFADRRLPAEPEPAPVAAAPSRPLRLKLEGVAISADARVALLRNTANNQLLSLAEGMSHDGWQLATLSPDRAVFTRGEEQSELLLEAK